MAKGFGRILYGGDYNPNQWPKEIWDQDMVYFRDAHINSATINVFSWAKIQPAEDTYYFDELDEIVEMLSKENYDIVLLPPPALCLPGCIRSIPRLPESTTLAGITSSVSGTIIAPTLWYSRSTPRLWWKNWLSVMHITPM